MFFLFVAWMAIIIMNLLIGLTISSLEKLNEKAEKMREKSRLDELKENKHVKKSFVRRREGIIKTLKDKSPSYKVFEICDYYWAFFDSHKNNDTVEQNFMHPHKMSYNEMNQFLTLNKEAVKAIKNWPVF